MKNCITCQFSPNFTKDNCICKRYKSLSKDTELFKEDNMIYYFKNGQKTYLDYCESWFLRSDLKESVISDGTELKICYNCNSVHVGDQCPTCLVCVSILKNLELLNTLYTYIQAIDNFLYKETAKPTMQ